MKQLMRAFMKAMAIYFLGHIAMELIFTVVTANYPLLTGLDLELRKKATVILAMVVTLIMWELGDNE